LANVEVQAIQDDVARVFYGHAMDQVLDDYRIDPEEEQFLHRLRAELGIEDEVAAQLKEEGTGRARQRFLSGAVAGDALFVASREARLELTGNSETTIEDAVRGAIDEANRAGANLHSAAIDEIRVELSDGSFERWHVKLKATLSGE
jgi:flavin-binding protein dodecin